MRISELARTVDVTVPTVKYYLRIGLLPAGEPVSATESSYGEDHVRRLRLIRALRDLVGLPIERISVVLSAIDDRSLTAYDALGRAIGALTLSAGSQPDGGAEQAGGQGFPLAEAAISRLGMTYDPEFPAVAQLERALAAAQTVGLEADDERLQIYGEHLRALAEFDLSRMPEQGSSAIEYAVLGTALHEPILMALRRLAHQDLAARRLAQP